MPRTKRPAALTAQPSTKRLEDLTQEERKKYDSILEDFDRQWEMHFTNMDKADEAFLKELEMLGKVAALSIPKAERKTPYCQWAPTFDPARARVDEDGRGTQQDEEADAMDKVMEEVSQQVSRQVNAAKQNIK